MVTKKEKERIQWKVEFKKGKRCETCGSAFELTLQHDVAPYMNHRAKVRDPALFKQVRILCATCHFEEDQEKMMLCYPRATLRKYARQCEAEENRREKLKRRSRSQVVNVGPTDKGAP